MQNNDAKEQSFIRLIKEYGPTITKVCYFYAVDSDDLNDLRQEVMINLWRGFDRYRGEASPSTWIYRVAVNSALMALRSSKPKIETVSLNFGLLDISSEADDAQRENLQALQSLINRLEDIEKAIMLLWLDEHSYDEIADIIGLKRNTVAVKIHRIKEKLSKQM